MKLVYDRFDYKRNQPYPNLWSKEITDYYDVQDGEYNYYGGKYWLRTCHSEVWTHIVKRRQDYVILDEEHELSLIDNSIHPGGYIYPIETYGGPSSLIYNAPGEKTMFISNVSEIALKLAKLGKLKFPKKKWFGGRGCMLLPVRLGPMVQNRGRHLYANS